MGGVLVPFYTTWAGLTLTQVLLIQSWFMIWIFLLEVPTGAVADYLGRKTSLVMGASVNALAAVVYAWKPSFAFFILGEFLWAMSVALISGADQALVYDSLKKNKKEHTAKKILARIRTAELMALMISAPIGSWIAVKLSPRYSMMFIAIPITLAAIIFKTYRKAY